MAMDLISTGLLGAAAGWAGQWFLIDRPIYRKLDGGTSSTLSAAMTATAKAPEVSADIQGKLDKCHADGKTLEAKLSDANDQIARLKGEVDEANAAFASSKKELTGLRGAMPNPDVRDDLELIDGIGPVFERKLYDAGVFTFAQLSQTSPEKIREAIKPQNWQKIEPEKWIAEAADFAKRGK